MNGSDGLSPGTYVADQNLEQRGLKDFIRRKFGKILSSFKQRQKRKKKREGEEEVEEVEEEKDTKILNLTTFTGLLLQYISAIIQKSGLDTSQYNPTSPLGQQLKSNYLTNISATTRMLQNIDQKEAGKGEMILVR